jgi:hypothetical protein
MPRHVERAVREVQYAQHPEDQRQNEGSSIRRPVGLPRRVERRHVFARPPRAAVTGLRRAAFEVAYQMPGNRR